MVIFIAMSIERSQRKAQVCKNFNILVSTQCNNFQPTPDGSQTSTTLIEIPLDSNGQLAPTILQYGDSPPVLPRPSSTTNPTKKEKLGHGEVSKHGKQSEDEEGFGRNRGDEDGECRSQSYEKPAATPICCSSSSQSRDFQQKSSN